MGVLEKTKCYLVGPIEQAADSGVNWRVEVESLLSEMGIIVYDPCNKPFSKSLLDETPHFQRYVKRLREEKRYDELAIIMKDVRIHDLRLVDLADFVIFNYDPDIPTCGSWEEFFESNRSKKPIFFICEKGKDRVPTWVFSCIPHKYIYGSLNSVILTLKDINDGKKEISSDRWRLLKKEYR